MDNQITARDWLLLANFILWSLMTGLIALFSISAFREKEKRAAAISAASLIGWSVWMMVAFFWLPSGLITTISISIVLTLLLYILPIGNTEPLKIGTVTSRVDERDVMFAREEYEGGSKKYQSYYSRQPEYQTMDDSIRALPELFAPGGKFYDETRSRALDSTFSEIERLASGVDCEVNPSLTNQNPDNATQFVRRFVLESGADAVGVAKLNPMWVYSHVGRGPEKWGREIDNHHKYVICFSLEMDHDMVSRAPGLSITEETARRYLDASRISTSLAARIRDLGYPARAHVAGSNYQIMLPPAAADAGLCELSRMGYLVSPSLGGRVRLGALTTDLPLHTDQPICFGVQDFCEKCLKCAENCPPKAIPDGARTNQRGVMKWQLNVEQCLRYWRTIGTDCGLCMKVCPFSHPQTFVHELVKWGVKRSSFARRLSVLGDNLLYGKRPPVTPG